MVDPKLVKKYDVPVPRYTSYPTVLNWKEGIDVRKWMDTFQRDFAVENKVNGISLYIHLPFCESLCTYCGCNKKITRNHEVETEYIRAVLQEWELYLALMEEPPVIRELHLGGGTPTFFSPDNLHLLLSEILNKAIVHPEHEFSFEGHPNNTTKDHLSELYELGFRRVSFGVQDADSEVQRIINRVQSFENVKYVTEAARSIGYKSVNFDLIYGLPFQTVASISRTAHQVAGLTPDRIAFYSYAHVPWTSRGQRLFDEHDLPRADEKMHLYQTGRQIFLENDYHDIGMDHFSLSSDDLYIASRDGELHRNFMGYTTQKTSMLVGLGVSSISSGPGAFAQNAKSIHNYYQHINNKKIAVEKGIFLSAEDARFGKYILDLSCKGSAKLSPDDMATINRYSPNTLKALEADELIILHGNEIIVTPLGRRFTRNICSAFDLYLAQNKANNHQFSRAV